MVKRFTTANDTTPMDYIYYVFNSFPVNLLIIMNSIVVFFNFPLVLSRLHGPILYLNISKKSKRLLIYTTEEGILPEWQKR